MENHSGSPRARAGQVEGVVARVPLLGVLAVEHLEVLGVLGVDRLGQVGLAVDERGAVEGGEEPLVRVDDERVGPLEAVEAARTDGAKSAAAPP